MMRILRPLLVLGLAAAALASCAQPEPDHDVAYYRAHPDVRATKMAACQNDRGRLGASSNCINALAADSAATSQKFWTAPKPAPRVQDPGKL
jgi:hypothetical protein